MKLKEMIQALQIPPTTTRVEKHTRKKINHAIRQKTIYYISIYRNASYDDLTCRLDELEHEWDTERVVELNDAILMTAVSIIGLTTKKPGWYFLGGVIGLFLAGHALQGWSPAQESIRGIGIRTPSEINIEKTALKYLRGDFNKSTDIPAEIYAMAAKDSRLDNV